jgi:hypothetical protein
LLDFRFSFAILSPVEETMTAGGSIASLGSPEPLAVVFQASHCSDCGSSHQEAPCSPKRKPFHRQAERRRH